MKNSIIIFLIFMTGAVLFAGKSGMLVEEKNYNVKDSKSVPNLIDYQGRITDSSNNPITSPVSIVFAIYDAEVDGTQLWTETHPTVTPVEGLVHAQLGGFASDLFDGSDLWLSINVNSDGEMTPRLRIVSVPYAIHANNADNLDGHAAAYFMPASTEFGINDLTDGKTIGNSVFLGTNTGTNDDGINNNVAIGRNTFYTNTTGDFNTAIGNSALGKNNIGNANTASGHSALNNNTGSWNTAYGASSLQENTSGQYNVGIGTLANYYNQEGSQNTIIGYYAGAGTTYHNKAGNIFLGCLSGYNESGSNKLYIENSDSATPLIYGEFDNDKIVINGEFQATGITRDSGGDSGTSGQVLSTTGTGTNWIDLSSGVIEINDLTDGKTGTSSVFLGSGSGSVNTGSNNTFLGVDSGTDNTSGLANTFIGRASGYSNTGGNYNTYLGYYSGLNSTGSSNVFLGQWAGYNEIGSNKLFIENSNTATPLIYGEFDNDMIIINGEFQATGITRDSGGDAGTSGQVLSSTSTGTDWVDAGSGDGHSLDAADGLPIDVIYVNTAGNVGINDITPSFDLDINGNFRVTGSMYDSGTDAGTIGQVLSSTGTGTNWVNASTGDITSVVAGTGLTGGGTSGDVTLSVAVPFNLTENVASSYSVIGGWNTGAGHGVIGKHNISGNYGLLGTATSGVYGSASTGGLAGSFLGDVHVTGTTTMDDVLHLTPMASAPTSPSNGDIYVGTDNHIYCYLGGTWKQLDN